MSHAADITEPKTLSAKDRLQALILSQMHAERAELCGKGQEPLREFFTMTAEFLRSVAE